MIQPKLCAYCQKQLSLFFQFDCKEDKCKAVMCYECFYKHKADCGKHDRLTNDDY